MRISVIVIVALGFLMLNPVEAQAAGKGKQPQASKVCSELKNATKGLYGLCVAYCSVKDQSDVDLNDTRSVKKAAASLGLWHKYEAKRAIYGGPPMPCRQNSGSTSTDDSDTDSGGSDDSGGTDSGGTDSGGSDGSGGTDSGGSDGSGGTAPPPPAQCPCWTGADLGSIDGNLMSVDGWEPVVVCTAREQDGVVYQEQVSEGYNIGLLPIFKSVAWASRDSGGDDPYNGCYFSDSSSVLNIELERAQADQCMQEVVAHCALLGNP